MGLQVPRRCGPGKAGPHGSFQETGLPAAPGVRQHSSFTTIRPSGVFLTSRGIRERRDVFDRLNDARVRGAAFDWLANEVERLGDVLPRDLLATGFQLDGKRVPLLGPPGIFKPRILEEVPLSLTTAPRGPYDDAFGPDGLLRYRYRGTDPGHRDNVGVRLAMERGLPLVYFHGIVPGKYVAAWPVFVVGDDPAALSFTVVVDDADHLGLRFDEIPAPLQVRESADAGRRMYVTSVVRRRLHQRAFRERVLEAYRHQCSFCRFRHEELLDAAHIIPDSELEGVPSVRNGLSLCKLHHAAYDRGFLGVSPDYVVEVRPDLLKEEDGPTLVHSIQSLHGSPLVLPRRPDDHPARDRLAERYERFLREPRAS